MNRPVQGESLPRKEREKLARQQEILKAARELFVTRGFRETTLDEIAHHAEFGKGTIYNYFANKEEIFFGIVDQSSQELMEISREAAATPGDARKKLQSYASRIIRYVMENGEMIHVVYHELHKSNDASSCLRLKEIMGNALRGRDILAAPLKAEIDKGALRAVAPDQLVQLFDGMLRAYCFERFAFASPRLGDDVEDEAETITSIFFDGIVKRKNKG
jgi:TetR/AcrR family transcriptional regulator, repressor of fatR-cypB operon